MFEWMLHDTHCNRLKCLFLSPSLSQILSVIQCYALLIHPPPSPTTVVEFQYSPLFTRRSFALTIQPPISKSLSFSPAHICHVWNQNEPSHSVRLSRFSSLTKSCLHAESQTHFPIYQWLRSRINNNKKKPRLDVAGRYTFSLLHTYETHLSWAEHNQNEF